MAGIFGESKKELREKITRLEKIQATEGARAEVILESMLTGIPISENGTINTYRNYGAQTSAIYRKYQGQDDLGNWQLRTLIDTRTAFICGEGISVQADNQETAEWINEFLKCNRMAGSRWLDAVKTGEMEGRVLLLLKPDRKRKMIRVIRMVSSHQGGNDFTVELSDVNDPESIKQILYTKGEMTEKVTDKFKYVKLGGDPGKVNETPTRCGLVLKEIDNYDRALNCMRVNNHLFSRVTPFFKTSSEKATTAILSKIKAMGWKLGQALAGEADFSLVVPPIGAMESLKAEMAQLAKAISATSGIPVHWLGHVDMMSNRATAEELYDVISNATSQDRAVWAESIYDLIVTAQELAIDNGMMEPGTLVDRDFTVSIPVVSFVKLESLVNALSKAFNDGAISVGTYRNLLPGVDPYIEAEAAEEQSESEIEQLKTEVEYEKRRQNDILTAGQVDPQGRRIGPQGGQGNPPNRQNGIGNE